jgi:hypothetical protein
MLCFPPDPLCRLHNSPGLCPLLPDGSAHDNNPSGMYVFFPGVVGGLIKVIVIDLQLKSMQFRQLYQILDFRKKDTLDRFA